eukprot:scaffold94_cov340-Prasinococcus_capsulatus_cf.AAC.4
MWTLAGKKVDKSLTSLGCSQIHTLGLGDDDQDIEGDFQSWLAELWPKLENKFGVKANETMAAEKPLPLFSVKTLPQGTRAASGLETRGASELNSKTATCDSEKHPFLATMEEHYELHRPGSERSCLQISLKADKRVKLKYSAGDHVGVYAENSDDIVKRTLRILGCHGDEMIVVKNERGESPFPCPISVERAIRTYCDVTGKVHRTQMRALAQVCTDEATASQLRHLACQEGSEEFTASIIQRKRSVLELMEEHNCRPGLGLFFAAVAMPMAPRFYSISSSPLEYPKNVHVTAAVVRERKPSGDMLNGVCTNWFASQRVATPVPCFIRTSSFRLPGSCSVPLVMVGPGTGLAPFLGFIQERRALQRQGKQLGEAVLFFGCRHPEHDFIHQEYLEQALADGIISGFHVAFSRYEEGKRYVQHNMRQQGELVWRMLSRQKGSLYVCGALSMSKDVDRVLHSIAQEHGGLTISQAEMTIHLMKEEHRYQRDVW